MHDVFIIMKTTSNTATAERRAARRQNIVQSATLHAENAHAMTPGALVSINNISATGISFDSAHPSDEGATCRVLINSDALRLNSRVRIVRCEKRDSRYAIGAEFIEELPEWKNPSDN